MSYEDYDKWKPKEGQRLLSDGKPCTFVEHDECYGVIWVSFDGEDKDRTTPIECVLVM